MPANRQPMDHHPTHRQRFAPRRPARAAALALTAVVALSGCSIISDSAGAASKLSGPYPQTFDSPYGDTTLTTQPKRVAVVSSVDLDIALALGATPVIAPGTGHDSSNESPWTEDALKKSGAEIESHFSASDGPDLDAISEAKPDVILATGLQSPGEHFDDLSQIAPVIAAAPDASWTDRTAAVATALNKPDEARQVVADISSEAKSTAEGHLEFADTTYTLADVRRSSIDYLSYSGSDTSFFDSIGMLPTADAEHYTEAKHTVKRSTVDDLDGDVLLIHFPDDGPAMLTEQDLEDPFYRNVKVIRGNHYAVLDDDTFDALTELSPLSVPWLLDEFPDELSQAEQGQG